MNEALNILVVGCGRMGASHASAYHNLPGFKIAGLVSSHGGSAGRLSKQLGGYPVFTDYPKALQLLRPQAVSVNTYADTHAEYTLRALEMGMSVFVEKPLCLSEGELKKIESAAIKARRLVMSGLILRYHPAYRKFVELARRMDKPLRMKMSFKENVAAFQFENRTKVFKAVSPLVDVGIHYVDLMLQIMGKRPVQISANGGNLRTKNIASGHYQSCASFVFSDGSIGAFNTEFRLAPESGVLKFCEALSGRNRVELIQPEDSSFQVNHWILEANGAERLIEKHIFRVNKEKLCLTQANNFYRQAAKKYAGVFEPQSLHSLAAILAADNAQKCRAKLS